MSGSYEFWFGNRELSQDQMSAQATAYNLTIKEAIENSDYFFAWSERETDYTCFSTRIPTTKEYVLNLLKEYLDISINDFNSWTNEGREDWFNEVYEKDIADGLVDENGWDDSSSGEIASVDITLEPYFLENDEMKGMQFIVDVTAYKG